MITLTDVKSLFEEDSPVPEGTLKQTVVDDFKMKELIGIPDSKLEISFNPDDGSDIIIKLIDPHAASGYLVFQDENAYNDWLGKQLYEPSQDEIEEASSHGAGA